MDTEHVCVRRTIARTWQYAANAGCSGAATYTSPMSSPPRVPPSLLRGRPLKNVTCPYCAAALDPDTRTKEHVIGRRFVPKGSTENRWNLILRACSVCNNKKSDLEDDIAAITMYFHTTGLASTEDPTARAEAMRRGPKSGSRKTGKPVADSQVLSQ